MAMIYDITNDTAANEGDMAIIKSYNIYGGIAFRLSFAAINYKYGGGKYTFIIKDGSTDAAWVSFILIGNKHSPFDPNYGAYYYTLGGHEYNNLPDYGAKVITPGYGMESPESDGWLGSDEWNGTAFTDGAKALLIKEWSI